MFGRKLGTVTLTANGAEGESHIFTSDENLEAVKTKFNKNYIPVGDSALSNAVVKYGETVEVELQEYLDIIPIFNFDIDFDKWKDHWIDKEERQEQQARSVLISLLVPVTPRLETIYKNPLASFAIIAIRFSEGGAISDTKSTPYLSQIGRNSSFSSNGRSGRISPSISISRQVEMNLSAP